MHHSLAYMSMWQCVLVPIVVAAKFLFTCLSKLVKSKWQFFCNVTPNNLPVNLNVTFCQNALHMSLVNDIIQAKWMSSNCRPCHQKINCTHLHFSLYNGKKKKKTKKSCAAKTKKTTVNHGPTVYKHTQETQIRLGSNLHARQPFCLHIAFIMEIFHLKACALIESWKMRIFNALCL